MFEVQDPVVQRTNTIVQQISYPADKSLKNVLWHPLDTVNPAFKQLDPGCYWEMCCCNLIGAVFQFSQEAQRAAKAQKQAEAGIKHKTSTDGTVGVMDHFVYMFLLCFLVLPIFPSPILIFFIWVVFFAQLILFYT